ncbi:MAG: SGNH/GDSL hydrolase family protein [Planctomycetota bacterium]
MSLSRILAFVIVVSLAFQVTSIQSWAETKAPAKKQKAPVRKPRPEFADPVVDESLPNVLLIGDSISIGYTLAVRKALKGEANVWRIPTNGGPTTRGIDQLDQWLSGRTYDLVHFNFGLHDLKYLAGDGKSLGDPKASDSRQQVLIDAYEKNLRMIATQLTSASKTVIWRETTPVPEGADGRIAGDEVRYNQVAAKVISEFEGMITDPMHAYALEIAEHQKPANVHYTSEGSRLLGVHVANVVREHLPE